MSNHWFKILVLSLACTLSNAFTSLAQSKETNAGTSTVSGRVTIKGEPAKDITVYLDSLQKREPGDPEPIPTAKTDENGQFRITGVRAGYYYVSPRAPGFIIPGVLYLGDKQPGKQLRVGDGENINNIEIGLRRDIVIKGRVLDSRSRPVAGERVWLWKLDDTEKPKLYDLGILQLRLLTDNSGNYRIYGIPEGRYILSIGSEWGIGAKTYQRTFYPNVTEESLAKVLEAKEGDEFTGIDLKVGEPMKTYSVSGRVVDADTGLPVGSAAISFGGPGISFGKSSIDTKRILLTGRPFVYANSVGEFRLTNITQGKFAVSTTAKDNSSKYISNPIRNYYSEPVFFEITDRDINGIEINVRKGGTISGQVVIEGDIEPAVLAKIPELVLAVYGLRDGTDQLTSYYNYNNNVNPDGSFQFHALPPGMTGIALNTRAELHGLNLVRIERNGLAQSENKIEIGAGEDISNLRLIISNGTLILRGEIKIVGGTLPQDISLSISASRVDGIPRPYGSQCDARNQFMIGSLLPGEYELRLGYSIGAPTGQPDIDPKLKQKISQVRQKIVVSANNQKPVILTLDLSPVVGNQ